MLRHPPHLQQGHRPAGWGRCCPLADACVSCKWVGQHPSHVVSGAARKNMWHGIILIRILTSKHSSAGLQPLH